MLTDLDGMEVEEFVADAVEITGLDLAKYELDKPILRVLFRDGDAGDVDLRFAHAVGAEAYPLPRRNPERLQGECGSPRESGAAVRGCCPGPSQGGVSPS